jgi:hypothetical protein
MVAGAHVEHFGAEAVQASAVEHVVEASADGQ